MDSSFTEEEDEKEVAPLMERLTKKMEQTYHSKALPINAKEDKQVSIEDKKIEQKGDLDSSVKESSTEPLKKKIKEDSCLDKEITQSPKSPTSEMYGDSRVLSSVGNLCDSATHENHLHIQSKQQGKQSAVGSEKRALTSSGEMESVQSTCKPSVTEKPNGGLKCQNGIQSNHKGPLLPMVNDSTKDRSRSDANSLSNMKLPKESELKNGTKRKEREREREGEQNTNSKKEDSSFAVGKFYLKSTDGKQKDIDKDHSRKRTKENHNVDHSSRENSWEDANMSPPIRPSKGKQLVTKNGKIKSKRKGTHERGNHSPRDERDTNESGSRQGLEGEVIIQNRSNGDESDGDTAASPVFKRSKYSSHSTNGSRSNSTKMSGRASNESLFSARRHSRRQSHEKLNLERKYPVSPKPDDRRRGNHSSHRLHSKKPHKYSKDVHSTSQGSHHRDERFHPKDKESHHRGSKIEERRVPDNESKEYLSEGSLSPSFKRGSEKPTSSPRYNKFLAQNQKSPKLASHALNDLPSSRSSGGEHDSLVTSSIHHKKHRDNKKQSSQEQNSVSPTERVSGSSVPTVERSGSSTMHISNTQFKKSHRSRGEKDKRRSSEMSNTSLSSRNHVTEGRELRSRHSKSDSLSQGVRSDCRFASVTSEVSLVQDSSATSQNNSRGYDMGGIGTPRRNSEEFYVHDIVSPDIFLDEDSFIEEVDVVTSSSRSRRRRISSQGNRQSVTEIIDDDDSVILLDDEMGRNSTPPQADRRGRQSGFSDDGNITPRTAAAINQLEADEAMARRLQLEFDREEAYVRTPPEPEELGMTEHFNPGEGQFTQRMVHSFIPEMYSNVITFGMGQGMMPWVQSTVETRTSRRGRNQRGRGNHRRRQHIHIEHLYHHQAEDDYERLLELEEQLGPAISQGLPPEILTQLPTFKFQADSKAKEEDRSCTICMADYQVNEDLRRLPCFHDYHRDCIDRWFQNNSACPICRVRVELN